jgi:hypothetical protein
MALSETAPSRTGDINLLGVNGNNFKICSDLKIGRIRDRPVHRACFQRRFRFRVHSPPRSDACRIEELDPATALGSVGQEKWPARPEVSMTISVEARARRIREFGPAYDHRASAWCQRSAESRLFDETERDGVVSLAVVASVLRETSGSPRRLTRQSRRPPGAPDAPLLRS